MAPPDVKVETTTAEKDEVGKTEDTAEDGSDPAEDVSSPPRADKVASASKEGSENTPTTEPMSPAPTSRAAAQDAAANNNGSFSHVLNPYLHYQHGTPPPPSPGTYDIHAMLLQQQAAMGASPYTPGQTYTGAMPPPPPLSPGGQNTTAAAANSAAAQHAAATAAHMVSPLMSPMAYGMASNSSLPGAEAATSLYLGQQAVPTSPVNTYSGLYGPQYGSASPDGKWTGAAGQYNQSGYPAQYQNQFGLGRSDSVQSADSASAGNDMLSASAMAHQNPAQAAYSQYAAARQMSAGATGGGSPGGAATTAHTSWAGGYNAAQSPYGAVAGMHRQEAQYQQRPGSYPPQQPGRYGMQQGMGGYAPGAPYYAATTPGPPIQTTPSNKGPDGANLFIFHIPNHFTNLDMYNLFMPYGNLLSVRIMVEKDTGRSRGFGFVSYDSPDSAAMAIKELNGFAIGNKRLKVQHKQIRSGEFGGPPSPQGGQAVYVDEYGAPSHLHDGGDATAGNEGGHLGSVAAARLPEVPSVDDHTNEAAEGVPSAPAVPPFETKVPTPHQIRSAPTSTNASPLGHFDAIRNSLPEAK